MTTIKLKILYITACFFLMTHLAKAQDWVDKKMSEMSLDEKIAQLMMIEVRPTYGSAHINKVYQTVEKYQVGGVIFFKGNPNQQIDLTNNIQYKSKIPVLVAIDGEWGINMRLSNTVKYPYQMTLGAIQDYELIYQMGCQVASECKRLGIHINFAPVADVNNNPNNPVIGYRSFGEDAGEVARRAYQYAKGMQDEGITACAKHFPGHGDTDVDSHKGLPVITHNRKRLDSVELYPFKYLIQNGVQSIMTAHLYMPEIEKSQNTAISISNKGVNELLKKEMGFEGIAVTDALNMQGVAKYFQPGELELKAFLAGNDILLGPENVEKAIQQIKNAILNRVVSEEYLNQKVRKILNLKLFHGLDSFIPIESTNVESDLYSANALYLKSRLAESALCVAADSLKLIPLSPITDKKIALLTIGKNPLNTFKKTLSEYHNYDNFSYTNYSSTKAKQSLIKKLKAYQKVVVVLSDLSKYPTNNYGVSAEVSSFLNELSANNNVINVLFGLPYALKDLQDLKTVLVTFEDDLAFQQKAALLISGTISAIGKLPVTVGKYKMGTGLTSSVLWTLETANPELVGVNHKKLSKVDVLAQKAINIGATPGCQILVAKNGKVIYQKSFGYHTYNKIQVVENTHLYDLASVTKVLATTLAIMKLQEEGALSIDDKISKYIDLVKGTNKENITIREILEHRAGLESWIPFYQSLLADEELYQKYVSDSFRDSFSVHMGNNVFLHKDINRYIFDEIVLSDISQNGKYNYSDLGMILLRYVVELASGASFDSYLNTTFYEPLGLRNTSFNPHLNKDLNNIVPTETNADLRKGEIKGYVHDPAAAMLGGISGHAGLFSNSFEIAVIMQMLLNGGSYNGVRYLQGSTIRQFTRRQNNQYRRGLGFDKPSIKNGNSSPTGRLASPECFGHTGFTGTAVWADPRFNLVYIFLSNRINPSAENKKLITENIRTEIMDEVYKAVR